MISLKILFQHIWLFFSVLFRYLGISVNNQVMQMVSWWYRAYSVETSSRSGSIRYQLRLPAKPEATGRDWRFRTDSRQASKARWSDRSPNASSRFWRSASDTVGSANTSELVSLEIGYSRDSDRDFLSTRSCRTIEAWRKCRKMNRWRSLFEVMLYSWFPRIDY